MKAILTSLLAGIVFASTSLAQPQYGWTISSSNTDPFANTGPIVNLEIFSLYLWLYCATGDGMSAASFEVYVPPGLPFVGFSPMNGFLNAGSGSNLLLAVGGCPHGPIVAGQLTFFGTGGIGGSICLVQSPEGQRVTVDCDTPVPHAWPIHAKGYGYGIPIATCDEELCGQGGPCSPVLRVVSNTTYAYRDCPVSVPIDIQAVCDLGAFQFDLLYDEAKFDFGSAALGPFLGSTGRSVVPVGPHVLPGRASYGAISFGNGAGPFGDGNLATMTLINRYAGTIPTTVGLNLDALEVLNTAGEAEASIWSSGDVNLLHYMYADFDANCEVTVTDLMQIASRWGSVAGDLEYHVRYDVDLVTPGDFCRSAPDGDIDIVDIQLGASRWAVTCETPQPYLAASPTGTLAPVSFALDPDLLVGAVGQIVPVGIRASGAQDLGAFELRLGFDPDVVEVVGARSGGFLENGENSAAVLTEPRGEGVQGVAAFSFGPAQGATGEGVVAYVDLRLKSCGQSPLLITDARSVTKGGTENPAGRVRGGSIVCAGTAVEEATGALAGIRIAPNPFGGVTTVSFELGASERVLVAVFDVAGRRVRELASGELSTGVHALPWDGRDDAGRIVPAGIYFVKVTGSLTRHTEKVVVAR